MYDFSDLEIPVFPGINDKDTAPTSSQGGSVGHLLRIFNELLDRTAQALNEIADLIPSEGDSGWIVVSEGEYDANPGEKILIDNSDGRAIRIDLPGTVQGTGVTIMGLSSTAEITVSIPGFYYEGQATEEVRFTSNRAMVEFIRLNDVTGWISTNKDEVSFTPMENPPSNVT